MILKIIKTKKKVSLLQDEKQLFFLLFIFKEMNFFSRIKISGRINVLCEGVVIYISIVKFFISGRISRGII